MGIGDFFQDVGDFIVPESVEDWAGGVAHGIGTIAGGAGWALNPTHWDDMVRGTARGVNWVAEHPGQAWDTGFEIGRHIVKEELLDPKNLAINLGLTAASIATGGGSSGLLAARMLKMGKAGATAFRAARSAEEGASMVRAIGAGVRGARSIERGVGVVRDVSRAADVAEDVGALGKVTRGVNRALDAPAQLRRGTREMLSDVTGGLINREGSFVTRHRN